MWALGVWEQAKSWPLRFVRERARSGMITTMLEMLCVDILVKINDIAVTVYTCSF